MDSAPWLSVGQTAGRWVDAGDLAIGDNIWRADGSTGDVESVEIVALQQRMYNLTVDVAHTFFVGDGQWLVHNCNSVNIAKHAEEHLDEFAEVGVNNLDQLAGFVNKVIESADISMTKLGGGKKAYWKYDDNDNYWGTLVIINPKQGDGLGGTIFRPQDGVDYLDKLD